MAQQESILKEISNSHLNPSRLKSPNGSGDRMGSLVLEYVTSKLNPASRVEERQFLQKNITKTIQSGLADGEVDGLWSSNLSVPRAIWTDSLNNLLASLNFAGMEDREWRVATAHHETFQWLFNENVWARKTNFKDWLVSEDKLYWITGKPGSGKSTLMKYISYADKGRGQANLRARCHEDLSKWSGDSKLVVASFYFWNSGTHMQTTQKGLMMTLLHQILKQCPDLAPLLFPAQWEMLCLFGNYARDWDEQELRDAVRQSIVHAPKCGARIALFIDGLDEFEGKSEELIKFLYDLLRLPNLKVCVSSRPWTAFEDAFRHKPSLRLEDLTYDDIKRFVTSRFDAEPLFRNLQQQEGQYAAALIESILSTAQGVFLWVALVVSSLIAGLTAGDRIVDLEKRLALLPPDLEGLYEKILLSLDPFYFEHAAQLFSLVATSKEPINVVVASFADEQAPGFCLRRQIEEVSEDDVKHSIDTMHRRLNTRTKGLLEVKRPSEVDVLQPLNPETFTIQYLHRTVKDYVEDEMAQKILRTAVKSSFDPHLQLLAGTVAYMKTLNAERLTMSTVGQHLFQCMEYARKVTNSNTPVMVVLLDELDKVITELWKRKAQTTAVNMFEEAKRIREGGLWALEIGPVPTPFHSHYQYFGHTFLSIAVASNVVEYVRARAFSPCIVKRPCLQKFPTRIVHEPWPLIMDVISINSPFIWRTLDVSYWDVFTPTREDQGSSSLVPMLECLLAKGADPAYLIDLPNRNLKTSLLIEMIAQMMRTQNQSLTEAARLVVRATVVDNRMLTRIIGRFRRGLRVVGIRDDSVYLREHSPSKFKQYRKRMIHVARQKNIDQQLQIALESLRNAEESDFFFNYAKATEGASRHSIAQLLVASHLTVLLTPGAKYHPSGIQRRLTAY